MPFAQCKNKDRCRRPGCHFIHPDHPDWAKARPDIGPLGGKGRGSHGQEGSHFKPMPRGPPSSKSSSSWGSTSSWGNDGASSSTASASKSTDRATSSGGWDAQAVNTGWGSSANPRNDEAPASSDNFWGTSSTSNPGWGNSDTSNLGWGNTSSGSAPGWGNHDSTEGQPSPSDTKTSEQRATEGWGTHRSWEDTVDTPIQPPPPPPVPQVDARPTSPRNHDQPLLSDIIQDHEMQDISTATSRRGSISTEYSARTQHPQVIQEATLSPATQYDFVKLFADSVQCHLAVEKVNKARENYNSYAASPSVKGAGVDARKTLDRRRKVLDEKLTRRTVHLDNLVATLAGSAPIDVMFSDASSKVDAVMNYSNEVKDLVEKTKPVVDKILALAVEPLPSEEKPIKQGPDAIIQPSPAAARLHSRLDYIDNCLDSMEVSSSLRVVPEPPAVKVNRMIDVKLMEHGIEKLPSLQSMLDPLVIADSTQGGELAQQAELTASAIVAQMQQKKELGSMMAKLNEAEAGLAKARQVADVQAAEIKELTEQLKILRERRARAARPQIDPELLLGEAVAQATAAITSYTSAIREELDRRDRAAAAFVWQAMEPARKLTVGVCTSMF